MATRYREARRQLEEFLSALFRPGELIELRFIESWLTQGQKRSRVVRAAQWLRADEFVSSHGRLTAFAKRKRANIYFGVCPRSSKGDANDESVQTVRCVWCDIDGVTLEDAERRWTAAGVPPPSIVVKSGTGIHGYWLLEQDLKCPDQKSRLAAMLPEFYRAFGGDHVQNLSRVMRPPGTVNYKDARNGREALPCTLCACDHELRYPLEAFSTWIAKEVPRPSQDTTRVCPHPAARFSAGEVITQHPEVLALLSRLEEPSRDRSRRDFAIVCELLRLGLSREEIWPLVSESSKFESNGRQYFDVTVANAEKRISHNQALRCQARALS
jgi:hypothetical protein